MAVIIPNMNIPTNCYACQLASNDYCLAGKFSIREEFGISFKHKNCPLKEVDYYADIRQEAHNAMHNLQELEALSELTEALVAQVGYNNKRMEELKKGLCGYVGEDVFSEGKEKTNDKNNL